MSILKKCDISRNHVPRGVQWAVSGQHDTFFWRAMSANVLGRADSVKDLGCVVPAQEKK